MPSSASTEPSLAALSGATRVHFIVGDPIAQVKSPAGVSRAFAQRGFDAVCLPAHVRSADLAAWLQGVSLGRNVDGVIATVPHKFACHALCATHTERAGFVGAVNTMRRAADGRWHGDMLDGMGFVQALREKACAPQGRRALLVGAGGAGSAIGWALVESGVAELAVHDSDTARRDTLVQRLASLKRARVIVGSDDPAGFDIAVNATPAGMQSNDPLPLRVDRLAASSVAGCVITAPAVTPFIAAARARGCTTVNGTDMFERVCDLMVDFLLGGEAS